MSRDLPYHHGDLRAALLGAAAAEIERRGYEILSLRELAASLAVSRSAPYRHFVDRRALLAALAAEGFDDLAAIYRNAISLGKTPQTRLAASGRAYLAFAAERPQLFRLMFASDLFNTRPLDPTLIKAAGDCYEVFDGLVAATLDDPNDSAIKAATIAVNLRPRRVLGDDGFQPEKRTLQGVRRKEDLTSRIGLRKRGPKVHRGRWPPFVSFETETMVQSERLNG